MVRAVWRVTYRAVLGHRRVLPEERSAFLGMAGITSFIERWFDQLSGGARSMNLVALRATQLTKTYGMRGGFEKLRPFLLVTFVTNIGLGRF